MQKINWKDVTIYSAPSKEVVTDAPDRMQVLRLVRDLGYCNGYFAVNPITGVPIRVFEVDWTGFENEYSKR